MVIDRFVAVQIAADQWRAMQDRGEGKLFTSSRQAHAVAAALNRRRKS